MDGGELGRGSMLNPQPSTYLRLWGWRDDKINLAGATQSIMVRIHYEKTLPLLTLRTSPVQIRSATDPLAFATAALAARSRGARALAADLLGSAQQATERLIERYIRPEQLKKRRCKPYGCRLRIIYLRGGVAAHRPNNSLCTNFGSARRRGRIARHCTMSVTVIPREAPCALPCRTITVVPGGVPVITVVPEPPPQPTAIAPMPAKIASTIG
jgi:hypothetical protein